MRALPQADTEPSTNHERDFRTLYDNHFSFVWRCLRGLGVAEAQLDDAAQEVFMVVHRRLPDFRGNSHVRTWIYGILRNVAANQRRAQQRRGPVLEFDQERAQDARPSPEQRLHARDRALFVERFVAALDERKRDVFVLALLEQLSVTDVAAILEIPLNTAYTRLRTVREDFRRALGRMRDEL